jgi:hypothetical protein
LGRKHRSGNVLDRRLHPGTRSRARLIDTPAGTRDAVINLRGEKRFGER